MHAARMVVMVGLATAWATSGLAQTRSVGLDLGAAQQQGERRVALVLGNKEYPNMPLANTRFDAEAMAAKLRALGFEVTTGFDQTQRQMEETIGRYVDGLREGDVSFVFYAGHGLQIGGSNFLVPVDFSAQREEDVKWTTFAVDKLMDGLDARRLRVNVVVLDACRNNPFRRTRSLGGGLAQVNGGRGSLIAFATGPGDTADDGPPGTHGVFTEALLKHLDSPGRDVEEIFKEVRIEVADRTRDRQLPWTNSSMRGRFQLKPVSTHAAPAVAAVTSGAGVAGAVMFPVPVPGVPAAPGAAAPNPTAPSPSAPPAATADGAWILPSGLKALRLPGGVHPKGCAPGDSACKDNEKGGEKVVIDAFSLMTTEVTAKAYQACVEAGACTGARTHRDTCTAGKQPTHPINCVSHVQAEAFCTWAGGRLPTAWEWEYAARGGQAVIWPWGNTPPSAKTAQFNASSTAPVGSHPEGRNAFGLDDMAGNTWEWTSTDLNGGKDVRGGGYYHLASSLRASNRMRGEPTEADTGIGFRCAK